MRRVVLVAAALLVATLSMWFFLGGRRPAPILSGSAARSNVLLITIDTLRADRVGAYGNISGLTPAIDRLAGSGLRFAAAFTPVPMTLPAHASILTGLEPFSHGIRNNTSFKLGKTPTLATFLKNAGYRTGAFVGAVVLSARFGLDRDFDVYDDRYGRSGGTANFRVTERRAERVIQPATEWILRPDTTTANPANGSGRDRLWFAWIHLYDPHAPYEAPGEYARGRSPYDAEVAYTDAMIARGLDALRAAGQLERTIVVIVGDHGEALGEHGESTHGLFAYDATLHVPMILSAPGIGPRVERTPVATVDLVPTVLDLLGFAVPSGLDGRSLLATEESGKRSARVLYFEALDANLTRGWAPLTGVMAGGWKYIDLPTPELYDLRRDPGELDNLAARDREQTRVLQSRLKGVGTSRAAPPEAERAALDAETSQRLASLGYIGSTQNTTRRTFSVADDPKNLVALNEAFYAAIQAQVDGHSESALTVLRDIVAKRPDFLAARLSAAAILGGGDRPAQAIALLQSAPGAAGSSAIQTQLGLAYEAAGNLVDAATSLESAARLSDGDLETLNSLAVVYARLRRFEEGRRLLRQILSSDPRAPAVWNNLGTLELSAGNRPAAADAFRHAVAADPNYAGAWRGLGQALVSTDAAGAAEAWRHTVALAPGDFDTLFNLGIVLSEGPQPQEALGYLQRFIAQAPADRYSVAVTRARMIVSRIERH
jgi:arylsulfatase A-like enzyme/Flp pilus assembly protein TadD